MPVIIRRRRLGRTSCRGIAEAGQHNYAVWRSDQPPPQGEEWPIIIRWGCTANIPFQGQRNIINTASAIHQVNDKLGFRRILNEAELCPRTWFSFHEAGFNNHGVSSPVVIRPARHAQGRNLHVCNTRDEVSRWTLHYAGIAEDQTGTPDNSYYISELINKVAEYRVCVAQGRAVWVAEKTPGNPDDVAWNVARGGRFDNVRWDNWPLRAVKACIEAFNLSELDFGGVDVMLDSDGNPYILEINSAPSLTSPYRQQCMARLFDYIVDNGKERIPLVQQRGGYLKFIHPAICDRARV